MNKQEALTKLTALEAETKALRAIIEAPDVPAVPTRWKPQDGDEYFQVSAYIGLVLSNRLTVLSQDEYDYGNCFKTHEHAEIAVKAVSQTLKICAAAFAVDPDAGEFIEGERRWAVDKTFGIWEALFAHDTSSYLIYVHTKRQVKQMAAILNAEGV
jgi:hypothetical protein